MTTTELEAHWLAINPEALKAQLKVLEGHFHIPVSTYRHCTFDHIA